MDRKLLTVQPRSLTGKKVAQMRRAGVLPGNVYGRGLDSVSIQIGTTEFEQALKSSVANEVFDLKVEDGEARPVVIHKVQRHPITSRILHADFFQVALGEKMRADVPLILIGSSEAVKTYNGVVVTGIESLQVEALPLDIVSQIEVDMSQMEQLEDTIHVSDLQVPPSLTVLSDPEVMVVKVATPRVVVEATDEAEEGVVSAEGAASEAATEAASGEAADEREGEPEES